MPIKLYKMDLSPPARAAMMACDLLNVPVEMIDVNLFQGDHLKPEYLKKNPLHTVPMLEDGGLVIHDSHAILQYLADVYGKDDSLYPKDTKKRAMVNQRLYFDLGTLFNRLRSITYTALVEGETKVPEKKLTDLQEAYGFLEAFLASSKWLAGDNMTIADVAAIVTVVAMNDILAIDASKYPKTQAWIIQMQKQPFYKKYGEPGAKLLGQKIKSILVYPDGFSN